MRTVFFLVLLQGARALAQDSQAKAESDALFDAGKADMQAGQTEKACAKFAASIKRLPQLGVRMNLADCDEKLGRTASAWAEFREAADEAKKLGDAREQFARAQVAALAPKLARMTISVAPKAKVAGLAVTRDDVPIDLDALDTAVPIDPGPHVVAASAPGFASWSQTVQVATTSVTVTVPELTPTAAVARTPIAHAPTAPIAPPPAAPAPAGSGSGRKTAGYVVGGIGALSLGATIITSVAAKSKWNDAIDHGECVGATCDAAGERLNSQARALGDVATVTFVAGAALVATGVILIVTAPRAHAERISVAPTIGPGAAGLVVGGCF